MGDSWYPSRGPPDGGRDRDSRHPPRDDYRSYPPPPPPGVNSVRYEEDRYNGRSRYKPRPADGYHRDAYPRNDHHNGGYAFRGAAGSSGGGGGGDSYRPRPPQGEFTFQSESRGLRFPQRQPPRREHPLPARAKGQQNRFQRNGGHQDSGRPWKRFLPKPAHNRAILQFTGGDMEPEQMLGMNVDGRSKFVEVESSDESEHDGDMASDAASIGEGPSRKRVKVDESTAAAEPDRPKWSNPDPYSVLPPTDLGIGPKKDIVQSIRKAKVETAGKTTVTNAIKDNDDFISFDFGEDNVKDDDDSSQGDDNDFMGHPPPPPPPPPEEIPPPPPPPPFVMPSDAELIDTYVNGGNKRKRNAESDTAPVAGPFVDEWLSNGINPTPWVSSDSGFRSNLGLNSLHREILDFYEYVAPREYERSSRLDIIDRIQRVVRNTHGGANIDIRAFGSFASGLYLPTADMDLVAVSPEYMRGGRPSYCQSSSQKHKLLARLNAARIPKHGSAVVIAKAKVPIIKFIDEKTGIKVDISFENDSGLVAIPTFEAWQARYPQMPKLVVIIKQFLAMRGWNEVFSGGIGGFTIICLVTSMLQMMPETQQGSADVSLGELLLHFFDLYGNKFDIAHTGIEMNPPRYFDKDRYAGRAKINKNTLTILDPNRPDNDISGGSRHISKVFECFRGAHTAIQRRLNDLRKGRSNSDSILGCILGGNYSTFEQQRNLLNSNVEQSGSLYTGPTIPQHSHQVRPTQSYYHSFHQQPLPPVATGLQHPLPPPPPPPSAHVAPQHAAPPGQGGQLPTNQTTAIGNKAQRKAQKLAAKKARRAAKAATAGSPSSAAATATIEPKDTKKLINKARSTEGGIEASAKPPAKSISDLEHRARTEGFQLTKGKKKALARAMGAGNDAGVQRLFQQARNGQPKSEPKAKKQKKKQKKEKASKTSQNSEKQQAKLAGAAKTETQNLSRNQRASKRAASAEIRA